MSASLVGSEMCIRDSIVAFCIPTHVGTGRGETVRAQAVDSPRSQLGAPGFHGLAHLPRGGFLARP
eukprot:3525306-Alexandrium_andersonii.AAC.1